MKLNLPQTIQNSATLNDLIRFTTLSLSRIQNVINGNVDFTDNITGQGDFINNLNVQLLTAVFPSATTISLPHSLGTVPRGFFNVGSSAAITLSYGNQANTSSTIFLASSAAGTVKVLVF